MKVLLLQTAPDTRAATVRRWEADLSLRPGDDILLLSWHHPAESLPVREQLCLGPRLASIGAPDAGAPDAGAAVVAGARWRVPAGGLPGGRLAGRAKRLLRATVTAWRFALGALRSGPARRLFAQADLVVPVDPGALRGAWLLARGNPGPAVLADMPAARSWLVRRRG